MRGSTEILKIKFTTEPEGKVLEYIITRLLSKGQKTVIVTPNPELVVLAHHIPEYQSVLNSAQISLPDGIGIGWASRVLKKRNLQRITGVDFMKNLCEKIAEQPVTVGLFGAVDGVAEKTADCLLKKYPGLQIVYASSTWDLKKATDAKIDILFVALGSPKQEQWISDHLDTLPVKVVMGVGGAFDMISGRVRRAPVIFQKVGLEWFWRLIVQPWRWKRQLRLIEFVWLVLKEKYLP